MDRQSPLLFLHLPKGERRYPSIYEPDVFMGNRPKFGLSITSPVWDKVPAEWRHLPKRSSRGLVRASNLRRPEVIPRGISMESFLRQYQALEARNMTGDTWLEGLDLTIGFTLYEFWYPRHVAEHVGRAGGWAASLQQVIVHFDENPNIGDAVWSDESWADELYNSFRRDP